MEHVHGAVFTAVTTGPDHPVGEAVPVHVGQREAVPEIGGRVRPWARQRQRDHRQEGIDRDRVPRAGVVHLEEDLAALPRVHDRGEGHTIGVPGPQPAVGPLLALRVHQPNIRARAGHRRPHDLDHQPQGALAIGGRRDVPPLLHPVGLHAPPLGHLPERALDPADAPPARVLLPVDTGAERRKSAPERMLTTDASPRGTGERQLRSAPRGSDQPVRIQARGERRCGGTKASVCGAERPALGADAALDHRPPAS